MSDLKGGTPADWLVIGWFTPDYRLLAEKFATNLAEHEAPFHLFARPKPATGWSTHQKPAVVLSAMDAYPDKVLILMDVDCIVRGDIAPMTHIDGDAAIIVMGNNLNNGRKRDFRIRLWCSSRVAVFCPTAGARAFAERWQDQLETSAFKHDENCMTWAFLSSPGVQFRHIHPAYAGREVEDAVIAHESAHRPERRRESRRSLKGLVKLIGHPFRSGKSARTKRERIGIVSLPATPAD